MRPPLSHVAIWRRVRPHAPAVLQTALAASVAWLLAELLLPAERPVFAPIAATIVLGSAYGRRGRRAFELIGGITVGLTTASLLAYMIGEGPLQIGLLVLLAMTTALIFRGGELLVGEAAVSAVLLGTYTHMTEFSADRILEGLIGGGVGLAVASLLFPPAPARLVGSSAQAIFAKLAGALTETADALESPDARRAERALEAVRGLDDDVDALEQALVVADETARYSPARRSDLWLVERYEQTLPKLDFAIRNARILVRYCARQSRTDVPAPRLAAALRQLTEATWMLSEQFENSERASAVRKGALTAARMAEEVYDLEPSMLTTQIVGQIRSVTVDLVRASDALSAAQDAPTWELPTEELLAVPTTDAHPVVGEPQVVTADATGSAPVDADGDPSPSAPVTHS